MEEKDVMNEISVLKIEFQHYKEIAQDLKNKYDKLDVTVQSIVSNMSLINLKLDNISNDLKLIKEEQKEMQKEQTQESNKTKFDFVYFCKDKVIPILLTLGITYFLIKGGIK